MKRTLLAVAAVATALVTAAGCSSGGSKGTSTTSLGTTSSNAKGTVNIWLMEDAQKSWPKAVSDANALFHKKFPNISVNITYQQWPTYQSKFDAAAQSDNEPDAMEVGNTQTELYMANGAFTDLTSQTGSFENSSTWLSGLTKSCTYQGKVYCIPYYAATRALVYRKDMFNKAGISGAPSTWSDLMSDVSKLEATYGSDKSFSPFYMPGDYEYGGLSFIIDAGGQLATQSSGKWQGDLASAKSEQGLKNWKSLIQAGYHGDLTANETNQAATMAAGKTAMFYGTQYDAATVYGPTNEGGNPALKSDVGIAPLPSPTTANGTVPDFVGGSDLAVPSKAKNPAWGAAWLRAYTSSQIENEFMADNAIPNSQSLANASNNQLVQQFAASLKGSWFTPEAKNWASLDQQKVFDTLLVAVATGKQTIDAAAKSADQQIASILNGASTG